jgi:hypothetical protein
VRKILYVIVVLKQAQGLDTAGIDIAVVGGASSIFSTSTSDFQRFNVHHAGYVSDVLAALYKGALIGVPTNTEGFGIPSLEAMARVARSFPRTRQVSSK